MSEQKATAKQEWVADVAEAARREELPPPPPPERTGDVSSH